jgi:hypothetical protein
MEFNQKCADHYFRFYLRAKILRIICGVYTIEIL